MDAIKLVAASFTILGLLWTSCAPPALPAGQSPTATTSRAETPVAKPSAPAPAATPKPAADQPRNGGALTVGIGGDPVSFDIHREESLFTYAISAAAHNNLLKPDPRGWPDFKPSADLATSWETSPDGSVYTFHLVKGAKFHDGSPVTAEDVKFSLDRIRDPELGLAKSPRRQQLSTITRIDTPDDSTVKVTLSYPQASFISVISTVYYSIYPKRVVLEKKNDMTKTIVGSGPFKLKDYSGGVMWEVVRNPDYFIKGRPYLDSVKGYIIVDSFARFAALRTRNILWYAPYPYMTTAQAKVIEETLSDKVALEWRFQPTWYGAIINVTRPPWNDVRVRQAVSLTFDRKKMLAIGLDGAGIIGMAAHPAGEWALPEDEMLKVPGYAKPDIEAAKRLMADAGQANGFKAETLVRAVKPHQDMAVLLKDAVAAIGIDLELKVVDSAIYQDTLFRKNFGIAAAGFSNPLVDPDTQLADFYLTGAGRNWAGYSNPQYEELYVKQSRTVDKEERRKIAFEMQRILLRDVPVPIAYWTNIPYVWWKEVRGFTPPIGFSQAFTYDDMWLAK